MQRILVVGCSGGGKTTFAAALARELGLVHVELDSIYHQPGWTALPEGEFRDRVAELTAQGGWVVDGNYANHLQDILWSRSDTIIWLDLPRVLVTWRVVRRSLGRLITRRELWNTNREEWRNVLSRDPRKSIVAWTWTEHGKYTRRYETDMEDPRWSHVTFIRLQTPGQIKEFLRGIGSASPV